MALMIYIITAQPRRQLREWEREWRCEAENELSGRQGKRTRTRSREGDMDNGAHRDR